MTVLIASLLVLAAPAAARGAITPDEFNSASLDTSVWSFVEPTGLGDVTMTGTQARISMPAGAGHDVWTGANTAPRLLQAAPNADVEVEVKFDSAVTKPYESQGLIVEQDPDDLLRVDVYHDGSATRLFAASMVGGTAVVEHQSTVASGAPAYLRLKRQGTQWTLRHSRDGVNWTAGATFDHAMTVTRIGPFASNGGLFPGAFAATIDHFRVVVPDATPPVLSGIAAGANALSATITWSTDEPASSEVAYGPTASYGSIAAATGRSASHSVRLPRLACGTTYHYEVRSADAAGNLARSADRTFSTSPCPTSVSSDAFDAAQIDGALWSFVDPVGGASSSATGTHAAIALQAGRRRDLWTGADEAARLLQAAPNGDVEVEVDFGSVVDQPYETQGLVVEQDADDLLRVDVHYDGSATRLFAASMVNGSATVEHQSTVPGGAPLLRLKRRGDEWTLRHSLDGVTWSPPATFAHAMTVRAIGPFAGNGSASPAAFTSEVDAFRVIAPDVTPPSLSGIAVEPVALGAEVTWSTGEPAGSEVAYGLDSSYGRTASSAAPTQSHAVSISQLTCGTTYHYEVRSRDASGNEARSGDRTFATSACPDGLSSDEFNAPALDTARWSFVDPRGDSLLTMNGAQAVLSVPAGTAHDVWTGANTAPRLLQAAPAGDFEVQVKFDTVPTEQFTMQGLLVEQGLSDLLRVGVHHDGTGLRLFIAKIEGGVASVVHDTAIAGGAPRYLRLKREGNAWTVKRSLDGEDWTVGASFTHAMTVRAIGPFAGNGGAVPRAYAAAVDHFRVVPPDLTPPVLSDIASAPTPISAKVSWRTDERATSSVVYGATTGYGQTVSRSTPVREHSMTVHGLKCATTYHFRVRSEDEFGNLASSTDRTLTTSACPTALSSDEFAGTAIDESLWTFVDPVGDTAAGIGDGRAVLSMPGGVGHDLWTGANRAPRLLQAAPDVDFETEVKFTSEVGAQYQMQGIVVAQDSNDLLRFEVHHDGLRTRLFIASIEDGVGSVEHVSTIDGGAPVYLRLRRSGDDWRLRHSQDGDEWSPAVTFGHALAVSAVGPFAGNNGSHPPAFSASIDYFRVVPPDVTPPAIGAVTADAEKITAQLSWTTDESTTSEVRYGPTTAYGTKVVEHDLRRSHAVTLSGLACGTTYHFQVRAADERGNETSAPDQTFVTDGCPAAIGSDEFGSATLDTGLWSFVDPVGDAELELDGDHAIITIPEGVNHDLWTDANRAPRLLQAVPPGDFEVEVKFDSEVVSRFQQQGIVVQQDADDLMRVEAHHDGDGTRLFIAVLKDGTASIEHRSVVPDGAPVHLRLGVRDGRWTLRYSADGVNWMVATRFDNPLRATAIGPFTGNNGATPPGFAAAIDHFRLVPPPPPDTAAPQISGIGAAARAFGAAVTWSTGEHAGSTVELGKTTAYELPAVSVPGLLLQHNVALRDLDCGTTYHYRVRSADAAGNGSVSGDRQLTTTACSPTGAPVIDVWYGPQQSVGHLGRAQRWVNVLGNVADPNGVKFLDYRLNGGPRTFVSTSTSKLRNAVPGDFNVELDVDALQVGANELELIAQDGGSRESRVTVTLQRVAGTTPGLPHGVAWSPATPIADVAQIVDGLWRAEPGAARTVGLGYDRVLAIGDRSWQDYEVELPITVHALSSETLHSGVGIGVGWQGHEGTSAPREDWPVGSVCFYYREGLTEPFSLWQLKFPAPHFTSTDGRDNALDLGRTYRWRFRTRRLASDPSVSRYSCKYWPADQAEPAAWDVTVDLPSRPGSVILIADHADVSFGDLSVRALP